MRWPRYGSHLLIQFYVSKTDENQRFLSVDFANEVRRKEEKNFFRLEIVFFFLAEETLWSRFGFLSLFNICF